MNLSRLKPLVVKLDAATTNLEQCVQRTRDLDERATSLRTERSALVQKIAREDEARVQKLMSLDERAEAIGSSAKAPSSAARPAPQLYQPRRRRGRLA